MYNDFSDAILLTCSVLFCIIGESRVLKRKGGKLMQLLAIVNDEKTNKITQLYFNKVNESIELAGFTVTGNGLEKIDENTMHVFGALLLGDNREMLGKHGDYDIILDKDSGLLHFFKDGIEDYARLFWKNGSSVSMSQVGKRLSEKDRKSLMRQIRIRNALFTGALYFTLGTLEVMMLLKIASLLGFRISYKEEPVDIFDGIGYFFSLSETEKFEAIDAEDIRNYIYDSRLETDTAKDFLWCPELIDDVLPYYEGTPLEIVSRIRHKSIGAEDFTIGENRSKGEEGCVGFYDYGNTLHVKGYESETFCKDSSEAETMGHEYVHLLQTISAYPFISESIAEIVNHEYFFKTASFEKEYSYSTSCKYTKVLMEIVGPVPVWKNSFTLNSDDLNRIVRDYLNEEDYDKFVEIMSLHPFYDSDKLDELYPVLEEILSKLYTEIYGGNMYDEGIIDAILHDRPHCRAYFNRVLMRRELAYYEFDQVSLERAYECGYVSAYYYGEISYEEYVDDNFMPEATKYCEERTVYTEDGGELNTTKVYMFCYEAKSSENLIRFENCERKIAIMPGCQIDEANGVVHFDEMQRIEVPSIGEKFELIDGGKGRSFIKQEER